MILNNRKNIDNIGKQKTSVVGGGCNLPYRCVVRFVWGVTFMGHSLLGETNNKINVQFSYFVVLTTMTYGINKLLAIIFCSLQNVLTCGLGSSVAIILFTNKV